jgi:hypothetical protein
MVVIGIDIGKTGAVAKVDHNGGAEVHDLPLRKVGEAKVVKVRSKKAPVPGKKAKTRVKQAVRICGDQLLALLRQLVPPGEAALIVYEDVQARPQGNGGAHGNSIQSQGSLMHSRGVVEGVLDVFGHETRAIRPQAWKEHFKLTETKEQKAANGGKADKNASREKAVALFPALAEQLRPVKAHNQSEACLIAAYGLSELT